MDGQEEEQAKWRRKAIKEIRKRDEDLSQEEERQNHLWGMPYISYHINIHTSPL